MYHLHHMTPTHNPTVTYRAEPLYDPPLAPRYVWILPTWGGIDYAARQLRYDVAAGHHSPGVYLLTRHNVPAIGRIVTIP